MDLSPKHSLPALFGIALAMASCSPAGSSADRSSASAARYLALGDSYTIGEGVTDREGFPAQLVTLLRARSERVADPEVIAQTGWTVEEMLAAVDREDPQGPYDLVTLLIGVNDQYRGYDISKYEASFARALDRAIELAGDDETNVVVLSIPDWGVSSFAEGRDRRVIADEIDLYNSMAKKITDVRGAEWVEITSFSRDATDSSMFAADGLHPSAMAYGEWARLALPAARAALD